MAIVIPLTLYEPLFLAYSTIIYYLNLLSDIASLIVTQRDVLRLDFADVVCRGHAVQSCDRDFAIVDAA